MDAGNPSTSLKLTNLSVRGSDAAPLEEVVTSRRTSGQWDPGRDADGERQLVSEKEAESVVDGVIPTAVTSINHKGAADKQRFNTLGYQKKQKHGVVPEFATVSKAVSGNIKPRGTLRQALFSQAPSEKAPSPEERAQLEALKHTLESFPLPALPDWKGQGGGGGGGGGGELGGGVADFTLEESWTHIVHSHSTMSRSQRHQQEAIWELIHTELSYIHKLTVVTDLVLAALTNLRQNGFLSEVTPELLFSNLPSILQAHHLFWRDVMLPMIQQVRETGKPFDPLKLESGCLQFNELFSPYLQYCWEEERIVDFTRRQQITSPQFHTYLTWVESHPYVGRMRLGDMQAKPHQRITKYPLLLRAILKSSQDPVTQYSVRRMLTSVNSFLDSINEHLRLKDDELALSLAAQRVEGYEVTEGLNEEIDKHIREICCFDLTSPVQGLGPSDIRKLLMEETLKIREKKDNKLEVVVLLFSDVLLVTKAQRKSEKLKVVRPPLALERTHCFTLKDGYSFVLVEVSDLGCAVSVYTIVAPSPESCSVWVSNIVKAQESLAARREAEMSHKLGEFRQTVAHIEKQALPPADTKRDKEEQENQSETENVLLSSLKLKDESQSWQKLETSPHQSAPSSTSSLGEESSANASAQELTPNDFQKQEMPAQLLDQNSQKKPKFRAQRSVSIPDIIVQAGPDLLLTPGWSSAISIFQSSPPQDGARSHTSSVEDILERARERTRDRERDEVKAGKTAARNFFLDFPPSSSLSTSPSPSPSEVDVDILGLHTSTIMGHKTKGGEEKEEGRGEESKTSFPLTDGASVDWPGWCFDDDEVLFSLVPEDRGGGAVGGDGGSRTLTLRDLRRISRQEDGEITEV
ncbi:hypothetical protein AGOR_G00207480 [Albula goreensis]|uniref:DH domain-containing protein n=1 Tax=Albula goreensis TaxID=1534307 RepID=A0A8T3CN06_9TELE|nr:hypothetical protein AGOR_G00207480 [Albula goreensis]